MQPIYNHSSLKSSFYGRNQSSWRLQFIGTCVDKNVQLSLPTKFGVIRPLTIQDIINSGPDTLLATVKSIKKAIADYDPELESPEGLRIQGLAAEDWQKMLILQLRKLKYKLHAASIKAKRKELEGIIHTAKTPEERRREAEASLAALTTPEDED